MNSSLTNFLDSEGCYKRTNLHAVEQALTRLNVTPHALFIKFYESYEGPFGSDFIGFILSDIVEGGETTIVNDTEYFRENESFRFSKEHLVISDILFKSVLVYDCGTDAVYNVDFEGGSDRLKEGSLEPQWPSFEAFLDFYFLGIQDAE